MGSRALTGGGLIDSRALAEGAPYELKGSLGGPSMDSRTQFLFTEDPR